MTKHDQALALLRSPESANLSREQVAEQVGCGRGTVRRAIAIIEAEKASGSSQASLAGGGEADSSSESERLLSAILDAQKAEEWIDAAIADLKEEMKSLKEQREKTQDRRRDAIRAARETYPLFDRGEREQERERDRQEGKSAPATVLRMGGVA